jgi:hypothetical protein
MVSVNNAGTLYEHFETNEQGFEMTMVVKYVRPSSQNPTLVSC